MNLLFVRGLGAFAICDGVEAVDGLMGAAAGDAFSVVGFVLGADSW